MSLVLVLLLEKENPRERPPLEMVTKATSKTRVRRTPFSFAPLVFLAKKKRRRKAPLELLARIALLHARIQSRMSLAIKRRVAVTVVAA